MTTEPQDKEDTKVVEIAPAIFGWLQHPSEEGRAVWEWRSKTEELKDEDCFGLPAHIFMSCAAAFLPSEGKCRVIERLGDVVSTEDTVIASRNRGSRLKFDVSPPDVPLQWLISTNNLHRAMKAIKRFLAVATITDMLGTLKLCLYRHEDFAPETDAWVGQLETTFIKGISARKPLKSRRLKLVVITMYHKGYSL